MSKVEGCKLSSVGTLEFDFVEGACNTFKHFLQFGYEERVWLCFDSSTIGFANQQCRS